MFVDKLKSNDFKCLRGNGKTFKTKNFLFVYSFNKSAESTRSIKAGFTITKKVGKAHLRNRLRRLLRETLRALSKVDDLEFKVENGFLNLHLNIVVLQKSPEKISLRDAHEQIHHFFEKRIFDQNFD